MSAETELKGTIQFDADTTEAERKLNSVTDNAGENIDAGQVGDDVEKALSDAAKAFGDSLGDAVESSLTQSISSVLSKFGSVGGLFAQAIKGTGANTGIGAQVAGAFGGAGGGGGAAIGGVGAAGAGGGGAAIGGLGAAGIVGLSIAAGIAAISIFVKAASVFKDITESLIQFGRGLTDASAAMAYNFAVFDLQIMFLKKRIGDELAPAMGQLLDQVVGLFKDVLPAFSVGLRFITNFIATELRSTREGLYILTGGLSGQKPSSYFGQKAASFVGGFEEGSYNAANVATLGLFGKILPKIERLVDKYLLGDGGENTQVNFMDRFHEFLVNEKSLQWQAAQTARNALTPQQQALYTPAPAVVHNPGGGFTFYPRGIP